MRDADVTSGCRLSQTQAFLPVTHPDSLAQLAQKMGLGEECSRGFQAFRGPQKMEPWSSRHLLLSGHEVSNFALPHACAMMHSLTMGPKAVVPVDHGPKPPKP